MRTRNETPNNKCVKRKHLRGGAIFCPSTVSQTQVLHPPRTIHVTTQTLYTLVRTFLTHCMHSSSHVFATPNNT